MTKKEQVLFQLANIIDPDLNKDIVTLGFIRDLVVESGKVSFAINLTTPACPVKDMFKKQAEDWVKKLDWVESVAVTMTAEPTKKRPTNTMPGLSNVRHIVAVASGKGGVGKSTVATNFAFSLAKTGAKVGIFDADIYGPSLPTMVGFEHVQLDMKDNNMIVPLECEGVKLMSFGYAVESSGESGPAIMRGPMVAQVIQQLLGSTDWGELDYLVIDMPPGTGDIQLTIGQQVPVTASVIVTTPQRISFVDVVKGIQMFDELNIPTVAVVENMAYFKCRDCTKKHPIFGRGALNSLKEEFGFTNAFQLPMEYELAYYADNGRPMVLEEENEVSKIFDDLSASVVREISKLEYDKHEPITVKAIESSETSDTPSKEHELQVIDSGKEHTLKSKVLRLACKCAYCVDEMTGKQRVLAQDIKEDVQAIDIKRVGNYAFGINWSDGHTSLYPTKSIMELCELQEKAKQLTS